ncbi:MAG: ATP-binding protein [Ardenticatenaceae bacterium]|nr:ATP-binding protein [Ardenticatenaceae bacterium]
MNNTDFRGRVEELKLLDDLWNNPSATLLILYGRRRVGKTRLLIHWLGKHPERGIYWVAEPSSALHQLRSFSQAIYNFSHPSTPAPQDFTYASWDQAFAEVARLAQNERLALFIDEITYLIDVDPTIVGKLQKLWDHVLKPTQIKLALAGSQRGVIEKMFAPQEPLYGRANALLDLPPLSFPVVCEFFPNYSLREKVQVYTMMGGVPAYLERLDPNLSIMDNIQQQLLTPNTLMREEPRLLLQDFISDAHNYVSILKAIAQGAQTQLEISNHTGLSQGHISKYLSVLRDTGFVERRVPATETEKSRRGHYNITDPYFRFYYRFMTTQSHVAMGRSQQTLDEIGQEMPAFIEQYTWRELCQQWLLEASNHGLLGVSLDRVGAAWTTKYFVDVVGISQRARRLFLGSCHWTSAPVGVEALRTLMKSADNVTPKRGEWTVDFVGFSLQGWTDGAKELAAAITADGEARKNWRSHSCRLLNLEDVYADLKQWFPLGDG